MKTAPHLLYLHGFNSSSQSFKADLMRQYMARLGLQQNLTIADIPPQPDLAVKYLQSLAQGIAEHAQICLMGSSLGGFYATWLSEQLGCKSVLINPAVRAHKLLRNYLGTNRNYHSGERWQFEPQHIDVLHSLYAERLRQPENYYVLLQTGDETLDYRDAEYYYRHGRLLIEQGGDHAFQNFASHIPASLQFCGFQLASN